MNLLCALLLIKLINIYPQTLSFKSAGLGSSPHWGWRWPGLFLLDQWVGQVRPSGLLFSGRTGLKTNSGLWMDNAHWAFSRLELVGMA